ncbi:MAG: glycosyltransferase family 2 protein [Thermoanaerobaculia bacterium]|nr:glycosyltransferase family 2 protein [Thermoanaerobaculia bacterium]
MSVSIDPGPAERRVVPPFTLVVPCYDEAAGAAQLLECLGDILEEFPESEIIVVDDGSTDGTGDVLTTLPGRAGLRVIAHAENRGYGAALKTGLRRAHHDLIVIVDADGTYPFDRLPDLLAEMADADMVVGARVGPGAAHPWLRRGPKAVLRRWAMWLTQTEIPDLNSGFRVFRKSVVERFLRILPDGFSFTTTITLAMLQSHYRVVWIPVAYAPRLGSSKIRPIADTLRFLQLMLRTGMYFAPLRILMPVATCLGLLFLGSATYDIVVLSNLTDKTLMLLLFTLNTVIFALLADMIDKRSSK